MLLSIMVGTGPIDYPFHVSNPSISLSFYTDIAPSNSIILEEICQY